MKFLTAQIFLALFSLTVFAFSCGDENDDQTNINDYNDADADSDTDADADSDTDADTDADADYGCVDNVAWHLGNAEGTSKPIKQKQPNAFGLYDMLGNVIEWVADCYYDTFDGAPTDGSIWDKSGCEFRVQKGGCFGAPASSLRVSKRDSARPNAYGTCTPGVRCVRDMGVPESTTYQLEHLVWVEIPGGTFKMGCSDDGGSTCLGNEFPLHDVTVPSFYMTESEVSGKDFFMVTGVNPNVDSTCPDCAAMNILFGDAQLFCSSIGARLATEAEWEYAARGGTEGAYYCQ